MMQTVYVTNPMLKPMLSYLDPELTVLGAWDTEVNFHQVEALATTVWETINADYLSRFPCLKVICHLGIGTDNIDREYLQQHQIILNSQPHAGIHDTSELAFTLMLSLARKIIPNHEYARANHWSERKARFLGNHLLGKQLGLVGLGQIGSRIARFAEAFGMEINYTARSQKDNSYRFYEHLHELASASDFLILCCAGGPETYHLIDENILQCLGPNSYLINVSRGSVIKQNALIEALKKGLIAGAGLDVFSQEPEIPLELRELPNVILSPHMGSSTHENLDLMFRLQATQLNEYFAVTV
ncbi:MAG: dihydrofolate reductase [Legionella sp.]|nr:MAG: dihydrofolate reductase [Legionella sp.]